MDGDIISFEIGSIDDGCVSVKDPAHFIESLANIFEHDPRLDDVKWLG